MGFFQKYAWSLTPSDIQHHNMIVYSHSNDFDGTTGDIAVRVILSQTTPPRDGDAAYLLFQRYGLDFDLPPSVRVHPAMAYRLGTNEALGHFPALVLPVQNKQGTYRGVELAFLSPDGSVAPVVDARQQFWLDEVEEGCFYAVDEPEAVYGVAVGLCDALAARYFTSVPVCAVLSANDLTALQIPSAVQALVIFSDATTSTEARLLQTRCEALGIRSQVMEPPTPHGTWLMEFAMRGAIPIDEVAESRAALDRTNDDSAE